MMVNCHNGAIPDFTIYKVEWEYRSQSFPFRMVRKDKIINTFAAANSFAKFLQRNHTSVRIREVWK